MKLIRVIADLFDHECCGKSISAEYPHEDHTCRCCIAIDSLKEIEKAKELAEDIAVLLEGKEGAAFDAKVMAYRIASLLS